MRPLLATIVGVLWGCSPKPADSDTAMSNGTTAETGGSSGGATGSSGGPLTGTIGEGSSEAGGVTTAGETGSMTATSATSATSTATGETGAMTSTGPGETTAGTDTGMTTATEPGTSTDTGETGMTTGMCGPGGDVCPEGTCKLAPELPCEMPMGPLGNGCCACECSVCTAPCRCAAPDTPVATPEGERAIASLRPGDLVFSVEGEAVVVVPVLEVRKQPAPADHTVMRVELADGGVLAISGGHPTADGRAFAGLRAGDSLGDARIVAIAPVAYGHAYTHDILPASSTGAYFAAGALVGSTLRPGGARAAGSSSSCR